MEMDFWDVTYFMGDRADRENAARVADEAGVRAGYTAAPYLRYTEPHGSEGYRIVSGWRKPEAG